MINATYHQSSIINYTSTQRIEARRSPDIPRRKRAHNAHLTLCNRPKLRRGIPITQIPPHQIKRDHIALARQEADLLETTQHFDGVGVGVRRLRQAEVDLRHCGAGYGAGVGDGHGDAVEHVPEGWVAAGGNGGGRWGGGDVA